MNLDKAEYYQNREWSWLSFNSRVLHEAAEEENPLLERVKFVAIVTANLEEFFMVRVAGLKKQEELGYPGNPADLRSPAEQLEEIRIRVRQMLTEQYRIFYKELLPALHKEKVIIETELEAVAAYRDTLKSVFYNEVYPVLTPISVGSTHPFPNLVTGHLYLVVTLIPEEGQEEILQGAELSFVEIPVNVFGRFWQLETNYYIPIELIIRLFVEDIYNGYHVEHAGIIRVTRDTDFSIDEDEASDLLREIETTIKRLHHRSVVKIEYEEGLPRDLVNVLQGKCHVNDDDTYVIKGLLNLKDLFEVYGNTRIPELKDTPMPPLVPFDLRVPDIFSVMRSRDCLLFHPYHSYDPVVALISQAADDPKVLAIKQTLYRTSSDSNIIKALVRAAESGKYVSVVVELKARFDERRNITWAKMLEDSGVHVIYGIAGLKTHAKALLIVRKESRGIQRYIHLATGNYNEATAKLYTDFSFFTADEHIGSDVAQLYNMLTGFSYPSSWNYITIAPLDLRDKFIMLIRREADKAEKGMKARITAMMNSLSDKEIAQELYKASQAGVKIQLIVRGICILKPKIKKVSENITVKSIIGKFLQHPRIFHFLNGGEEEYYLSSADWMSRNLDRRVELLFPVRDEGLQEFLQKMLKIQLDDIDNAWEMESNGEYSKVSGKKSRNCFNEIYDKIRKEIKQEEETQETEAFRPVRSME